MMMVVAVFVHLRVFGVHAGGMGLEVMLGKGRSGACQQKQGGKGKHLHGVTIARSGMRV